VKVFQQERHFRTRGGLHVTDITEDVREIVAESGVVDGICCVYSPHTTCCVRVNEFEAGFLDDFTKVRRRRSLGLSKSGKFLGTAIVSAIFAQIDVFGFERLEYELTQKLGPGESGPPRPLITNLCLSQTAYDLLARLPGDDLSKTRYSVAPLAIGGIDVFDVFEPPLDGLVLAESEFETDEAMAAFRPPEFVLAEVTNEPRFSGAHLARTGRAVLRAVLAEFGIRIDLP